MDKMNCVLLLFYPWNNHSMEMVQKLLDKIEPLQAFANTLCGNSKKCTTPHLDNAFQLEICITIKCFIPHNQTKIVDKYFPKPDKKERWMADQCNNKALQLALGFLRSILNPIRPNKITRKMVLLLIYIMANPKAINWIFVLNDILFMQVKSLQIKISLSITLKAIQAIYPPSTYKYFEDPTNGTIQLDYEEKHESKQKRQQPRRKKALS